MKLRLPRSITGSGCWRRCATPCRTLCMQAAGLLHECRAQSAHMVLVWCGNHMHAQQGTVADRIVGTSLASQGGFCSCTTCKTVLAAVSVCAPRSILVYRTLQQPSQSSCNSVVRCTWTLVHTVWIVMFDGTYTAHLNAGHSIAFISCNTLPLLLHCMVIVFYRSRTWMVMQKLRM